MKSLELFAGTGGLGLGVASAGFTPMAVIERDRHCCETLRLNGEAGPGAAKHWPIIEQDIRTVDFGAFEGFVDLISGGPPCQPFSIGGKGRGHADHRDMFPEAVRAVRQTKPKAFLFENVKGLTRSSFASYFEYIRLQLTYPEVEIRDSEDWLDHLAKLERHHTHGNQRGLNYRLLIRVLNAADFGVPQKRERVFFVGLREDLDLEWSFPDPTHSLDALLWQQWKTKEYWGRHGVSPEEGVLDLRLRDRAQRILRKPALLPWITVRDTVGDLPDPETHLCFDVPNHRFQPGARQYPGHTGSPLDEPAKTLKAGDHGVPGGENMMLRQGGSVRYFSVRESARLQTFPDSYTFSGSWTEAMRQLGNAVPVELAHTLASSIRTALEQGQTQCQKQTSMPYLSS